MTVLWCITNLNYDQTCIIYLRRHDSYFSVNIANFSGTCIILLIKPSICGSKWDLFQVIYRFMILLSPKCNRHCLISPAVGVYTKLIHHIYYYYYLQLNHLPYFLLIKFIWFAFDYQNNRFHIKTLHLFSHVDVTHTHTHTHTYIY